MLTSSSYLSGASALADQPWGPHRKQFQSKLLEIDSTAVGGAEFTSARRVLVLPPGPTQDSRKPDVEFMDPVVRPDPREDGDCRLELEEGKAYSSTLLTGGERTPVL